LSFRSRKAGEESAVFEARGLPVATRRNRGRAAFESRWPMCYRCRNCVAQRGRPQTKSTRGAQPPSAAFLPNENRR